MVLRSKLCCPPCMFLVSSFLSQKEPFSCMRIRLFAKLADTFVAGVFDYIFAKERPHWQCAQLCSCAQAVKHTKISIHPEALSIGRVSRSVILPKGLGVSVQNTHAPPSSPESFSVFKCSYVLDIRHSYLHECDLQHSKMRHHAVKQVTRLA